MTDQEKPELSFDRYLLEVLLMIPATAWVAFWRIVEFGDDRK